MRGVFFCFVSIGRTIHIVRLAGFLYRLGACCLHQLVIARYAEQLDWLTRVPAEFSVHIYNKGAPITDPQVIARADSVTDRPNQGRESETYLTHISSLSPDADDGFVVFSQGDPFEHSPDFLELLGRHGQWQDLQPLAWRWKISRRIPPDLVLARETGGFVDGLRVRPELFSLQSWTPMGFHDEGTLWLQETYRQVHRLVPGTNIAAHFLAMCGLADIAGRAQAHLLGRFSYGAVFAARRSRLAGVMPDALEGLRRAALGHEVYGYVLERLWLHLFGADFLLPALLPGPAELDALDGPVFVAPDRRSKRRRKIESVVRRVKSAVALSAGS